MQMHSVDQVAMQQSATDPDTGAIDMDIIQTGVSASRRRDREALANELANLLIGGYPHVHVIIDAGSFVICMTCWTRTKREVNFYDFCRGFKLSLDTRC